MTNDKQNKETPVEKVMKLVGMARDEQQRNFARIMEMEREQAKERKQFEDILDTVLSALSDFQQKWPKRITSVSPFPQVSGYYSVAFKILTPADGEVEVIFSKYGPVAEFHARGHRLVGFSISDSSASESIVDYLCTLMASSVLTHILDQQDA